MAIKEKPIKLGKRLQEASKIVFLSRSFDHTPNIIQNTVNNLEDCVKLSKTQ